MITKYGTDNVVFLMGFAFLVCLLTYFFIDSIAKWGFYTLAGLIALFTLWFFRDPDRTIPSLALTDSSILIAPADGKVVEIVEVHEPLFVKEPCKRISIFLSPLDVHVNRTPITGVVKFFQYNPGDYLVAWHPKSSELNEQTRIGVENQFGKVLFKQITGFLARRIVCTIKEGDSLTVGDQIGMMKFGSRMDIIVPASAVIAVRVGDRTVAGETPIATLARQSKLETAEPPK